MQPTTEDVTNRFIAQEKELHLKNQRERVQAGAKARRMQETAEENELHLEKARERVQARRMQETAQEKEVCPEKAHKKGFCLGHRMHTALNKCRVCWNSMYSYFICEILVVESALELNFSMKNGVPKIGIGPGLKYWLGHHLMPNCSSNKDIDE